jgi:hypothetical protein
MWQLAPDIKCALWPVVLYFNWCILLGFKTTKLVSCVMQLLTAGGPLRYTTSVLAPAQQHTNCIAVARRFFPVSQNKVFLCSWGPESFTVIFRATRNASAAHEMQFFISSFLCTLCAYFLHFLWNFCYVCVCLVQVHNTNSISRECLRTSVYLSLSNIAPYCPCRTLHLTVPAEHCTLLSLQNIAPYCPVTSRNVQFYFPSSLLIVQGQLNFHTSLGHIAFWRKIKIWLLNFS